MGPGTDWVSIHRYSHRVHFAHKVKDPYSKLSG